MIRTPGSLDAFTKTLSESDAPGGWGNAAASILRNRLYSPQSLAPFIHFEPSRYTRHLIYRSAEFEVIALCWSPGSGSPIHDHGGMHCSMMVYSGSLIVEDFTIISSNVQYGYAQVAANGSSTLKPGDLDVRTSDRDLHRVYAQDEPTISLHVYARPLETFLVFDLANRSCRPATARYDSS